MPTAEARSLKTQLLALLLERLEQEYQTLVAAQRATHEAATHEEAKPENDKDTRALEQSYLARGQAERVHQLERDVGLLQTLSVRPFSAESPIALGALITLTDEGSNEHLHFLVPAGAGESLEGAWGTARTITPQSPLGRALVGSYEGDELEVEGPRGKRFVHIRRVC